jgi:hypothetical protein
MLRLAGLPQRCVSDFLPPAFRRSSRDKKEQITHMLRDAMSTVMRGSAEPRDRDI